MQPTIACLGFTAERDFPLLLVFGREYNNDGSVANFLGEYSFDESPRSHFWNRTYKFIERNCEMASKFKMTCITERASPVLFSNVLPKPIPTQLSDATKKKIRLAIFQEEIGEYIDGIFSLPIVDRVRLAVLSGVEGESVFGYSTNRIHRACGMRGIDVVSLPYFGSRSLNAKIDDALSKSNRKAMCSVINSFYNASFKLGA